MKCITSASGNDIDQITADNQVDIFGGDKSVDNYIIIKTQNINCSNDQQMHIETNLQQPITIFIMIVETEGQGDDLIAKPLVKRVNVESQCN